MDGDRIVAGSDIHKDSIYLCIMRQDGAILLLKDAQWIAECLLKSLIRESFVPELVVQDMR